MVVTVAVAGITAFDLYTAIRASKTRHGKGPMRVRATITINRPREEVYRYWRDFEKLPQFMTHLESVRSLGERRSQWRARGPMGGVQWEAEIIEDRVGELITWGSIRGADVSTNGSVRFTNALGGHGTVVQVDLTYGTPGRALSAVIARLLGEHPEQQIRDDLRRFKQVMETGEVVRSEASPEGAYTPRLAAQRPAQPVGSGGRS
ncbi:SRPBCC family protein [Nonomuraea sp. NPDC005983]|uniref:SRPBCC family protein n=1 Tax=Nonomuraea sp. NPDC005983 TaxID=3155595 RepID=UPI0033B273CE